MIKLLIAEDHAVVRKAIVGVLIKQGDMEVVGEAQNGVLALQLLQNGLRPDILLTDLNMPLMNGIQLLQHILPLELKLSGIILTMHADTVFLAKALAAGARGYLLKNGDMDELVACIRSVHNGQLMIGEGLK